MINHFNNDFNDLLNKYDDKKYVLLLLECNIEEAKFSYYINITKIDNDEKEIGVFLLENYGDEFN